MPRLSDQPPIRAAVVGTGQIAGWSHLPAARALAADLEVVAAVDIDSERLHAFADEWSIRGRYLDVAAMLAAESPDLVMICTPPEVHREHAVAALNAGAWVWCEKPPAVSLADYDAIVSAESTGGPYAAVVFQQRFGSGARHARQLIRTGSLGRPLVVHCQTTWYRNAEYFVAPWRGSFWGDGGPAMALGIHQIDLVLSMVGPWREVRAITADTARGLETGDVSAALVCYDNGAVGTVVNSAVSAREESYVRIDAEYATVEATYLYGQDNTHWRYTPAPGVGPDQAAGWANPLANEPSGHLPQLRSLIADMRSGTPPQTGGDGGRAALELITSMYRSALTGEVVKRGQIGADDPFYHRLDGGQGGSQ